MDARLTDCRVCVLRWYLTQENCVVMKSVLECVSFGFSFNRRVSMP